MNPPIACRDGGRGWRWSIFSAFLAGIACSFTRARGDFPYHAHCNPGLRQIRRNMPPLVHAWTAICLALLADPGLADEIIDSGWANIRPSALARKIQAPPIMVSGGRVLERPAIRTDALSGIRMHIVATNKVDDRPYFDLGVPARDAHGDVFFAFELSPDLFGIWPGHPNRLSRSIYAVPGILEDVALYPASVHRIQAVFRTGFRG